MQKEFHIVVDIGKKILTPVFEVNTNDLKSVKLVITITHGLIPLDLTGTTVRIAIKKPDNTIVFQDCTVKDAKKGLTEVVLENQAYIKSGNHIAEVMCYKNQEVVAVSGTFSYRAITGILNEQSVESKTELTAIAKQLKDVEDTIEDLREKGTGIDAQARKDIENVSTQLSEVVTNVKTFGAKGDGVTDDTVAFQTAVDHLKSLGGGTLFVPDTGNEYFFKDGVKLCDNLKITSNGATISKNGNALTYYIFLGLSGNKTGYGSGPSNIVFDGIKFKGSFRDNRGASVTLHHSKNVTFQNCTFTECVISGHAIDLGGCSDIMIRNSYFYGQRPTAGREYTEAIQIDNSIAEGNGGIDGAYDGLPCKNITVEFCKFLPYTVNGVNYPAPNPLGSHSRVEGQLFTNIKFLHNQVIDAVATPNAETPYAVGWLHFYHVDGLEISNNEFINTDGRDARALGLYSLDTTIKMEDIHLVSPPKKPYNPVPAKNVIIRENKIKGFSNEINGRIIYLQGREVNSKKYYLENIRIISNNFSDCYNDSLGIRNAHSDLIYADKVIGLTVSENDCKKVRRLLYADSIKKTKILNNIFDGAYWSPININDSEDVTAFNNTAERFGGGFYFRAVKNLNVNNNTFATGYPEAAGSYSNIIAVNNCSRFAVKDNDFSDAANSPYKSIEVYGASSTGFVRDNIITGVSLGRVSADSTGVVVT